jgi:hypothetical protein
MLMLEMALTRKFKREERFKTNYGNGLKVKEGLKMDDADK